jgi:hypothetical protein
MNDFEQVLAFWALINDLIEWILARAAVNAPENGAISGRRIGMLRGYAMICLQKNYSNTTSAKL